LHKGSIWRGRFQGLTDLETRLQGASPDEVGQVVIANDLKHHRLVPPVVIVVEVVCTAVQRKGQAVAARADQQRGNFDGDLPDLARLLA